MEYKLHNGSSGLCRKDVPKQIKSEYPTTGWQIYRAMRRRVDMVKVQFKNTGRDIFRQQQINWKKEM